MSDHDHAFPGGLAEDHADPLGPPVDTALIRRFIGAAYDGCPTCQDAELTLVVSDPATCARLVELACVAAEAVFGFIPKNMTDPTEAGQATPAFRELARIGCNGGNAAMFDACAAMSPTARRAAANSATDTLLGIIA